MVPLRIVSNSVVPLYKQLVDQVRWAAVTGTLVPGEALPSVRAVAELLVINPNTVAKAYSELTREGVIEARAGKGCFVSERRQVFSKAERSRRLEEALDTFVNEAAYLGIAPDEIRMILERRLAELKPDLSKGTTP